MRFQDLITHSTALVEAMSAVSDKLQALATLQPYVGQLETALTQMSSIDSDDLTAMQGALSTLQDESSAIQSLGNSTQDVAALVSGASQLSTGLDTYTAGVSSALSGSNQLTSGLSQLNAQVPTLTNGVTQIMNGTAKLAKNGSALKSGSKQLASGTSTLNNGLQTAAAGVNKLTANTGKLTSAGNKLNSSTGQLTTAGHKLNSSTGQLTSAGNKLNQAAPQLTSGASQLASGTAELNSKVPTLTSGVNQLANGSAKLNNNSGKLNDGTNQLKNGTGKLAKSLQDGADQVNAQPLTSKTADMFASPTKLNHKNYSYVPNYGHALAPYVLSVALYVGALVFNFVFPIRKVSLAGGTATGWFLSKLSIGAFEALAMAVVEPLLMMLGGLSVDHPGQLILVSIFFAEASMFIVMFLSMLLDNPGRFVAMVLLMLQLGGSGGTFPMEVTNHFFNVVHPFLPMTYSILGFRQAITSGMGGGSMIGQAVLILGAFAVISIICLYPTMQWLQKKHLMGVSQLDDNQKLQAVEDAHTNQHS